ncbi:MAG: hypothetical protein WAZ27_04995 [Minisyncoccia bacterium]
MDPREKGDRNEEKVLNALLELKNWYPDFVDTMTGPNLVRRVRRASPAMDARGIDILAQIGMPEGSPKKQMTVPIQVKSSSKGAAKWKVVHSDLYNAGVLIIYVPDNFSPRRLRRLVYRALMRVQANSREGMLYHSMFQRLFERKGSKNLQKNIDLIKENRARNKNRPTSSKKR